MIRPAPIYPPAILHIAAIIPNRKSTCPLKRKIQRDVIFVVRLMTLACALAVLMLSFANTVKAIIRKVPVPGP